MKAPSKQLDTLCTAILLALGLLALAAADLVGGAATLYQGRVVESIVEQVRASSVTMARLYAFVIKVLLVYTTLGVVSWLASLLTFSAVPEARRYRQLVVMGWFVSLTLLVGLINADLYPWSRTGRWSRVIHDYMSGVIPAWVVLAAVIGIVLGAFAVLWVRQRGIPKHAPRVLIWSGVLMLVGISLKNAPFSAAEIEGANLGPPNIVLIGIDSLRPTVVGDRQHPGYMPKLSSFLNGAHRFTDATTPLARTFPSWMALLTGLRPTTSGLRENLMPKESVDVVTISGVLADQGYHTIYATDEVRFSNIDSSYGFETVLTPRIGASDFLLGGLNDLPVTNLIANSKLGKWLFPETYANRAAAVTYDPAAFVSRLRSDIRVDDRPVFLAMHLTLPHWPYRWRADEDEVFADTADSIYAYLAAVVEVDKQFDSVLGVLDRKGLLQNTWVIVFSDHGEALNLPNDHLVRVADRDTVVEGVQMWASGHGTTVLSAPQYEIFLAARSFGAGGREDSRSVHDDPISIEDIAPTILELAGLTEKNAGMDGRSFARRLSYSSATPGVDTGQIRVRFTESAYSTPSLRQGAADEKSLLEEGADVFRVNPSSGWVEIRTDLWSELMAVRERAAIGPTRVLAAIPSSVTGETRYLVVPRKGGAPQKLLGPPESELGDEVALLWKALFEEYGGELGQPVQ